MMKYLGLILAALVMVSCGSKSSTMSETETKANELVFLEASQIDAAQKQALKEGKLVFIDVSTSWCGYCKKMKKSTYTDSQVIQALSQKYVTVSVDAEQVDGIPIAKKYGVSAYPTQIIIDSEGNAIKKNVGYLDPDELLKFGS